MRFLYYIFSSIIVYFIYNLLIIGYDKISIVNVFIFGGIVGLAIANYFRKNKNRVYNKSIAPQKNYGCADIIRKIPASIYYKKILTIGGYIVLTKKDILFVPHKFNFKYITIEIPLENILKVSIKKVLWGMFNSCILTIHIDKSNCKKFLVDRTNSIELELFLNKKNK